MNHPYPFKTSPYFLALKDTPKSKQMFVGRTEELLSLTHSIQNDWLALYGERRIGKSFLSIIFRDVMNQGFDQYLEQMVDPDTAATIRNCARELKAWKAIYVNLQEVQSEAVLCRRISKAVKELGFDIELGDDTSHAEIFPLLTHLENLLRDHPLCQKIVLILDEFEMISKYASGREMLSGLRALSQSCDFLRIILTGSLGLKGLEFREIYSPFINVIKLMPIRPLDASETKTLIKPLQGTVPFTEAIPDLIFELAGGNPYLTQTICQTVFEELAPKAVTLTPENFKRLWKDQWEWRIISQSQPVLRGYLFELGKTTELYHLVAVALCHAGSASAKDLSAKLNIDEKTVNACLLEFQSLGKVQKTGTKFQMAAKLIETYGREYLPLPKAPSAPPSSAPNLIQISGSQGITIGDHTEVKQSYQDEKKQKRKRR